MALQAAGPPPAAGGAQADENAALLVQFGPFSRARRIEQNLQKFSLPIRTLIFQI